MVDGCSIPGYIAGLGRTRNNILMGREDVGIYTEGLQLGLGRID